MYASRKIIATLKSYKQVPLSKTHYTVAEAFGGHFFYKKVTRSVYASLRKQSKINSMNKNKEDVMKRILLVLVLCLLVFLPAGAGAYEMTFYAEDAIIDEAPGMILEPEESPYNLGGWAGDSVVYFPMEVYGSGWYNVELIYSKEGREPDVDISITTDSGASLNAVLYSTSGPNDWSVYMSAFVGRIWLTEEDSYLRIARAEDSLYSEHVMNLREVRLVQQEGDVLALWPWDAILENAPDVIVEPEEWPYNLGNWKADNVVYFPVSIEEEGLYLVEVEYSREGSAGETDVTIATEGGESVSMDLWPTGDSGDWSRYQLASFGPLWLTPEDTLIAIGQEEYLDGDLYLINLRQLRLSRYRS